MQKNFCLPKKIESIQFLRFVAALAVSFYHFGIVTDITNTAFNVTFFLRLFFTISGFIIMLSTQKEEKKYGFLCRRLIRLVPLYWLLTLTVFAAAQILPSLIGYKPTVMQLIKSMMFIPFSRETLKSGVTLRPIVGLGHTLQMEILFSLVFAVAMRISHKYRGLISGITMVVLALIGIFVPFETDFCMFSLNKNYLALLSFGVGILCYYLIRWLQALSARNNVLFASGLVASVVTIVLAHVLFVYADSSELVCAVDYLIFIAVIICASAYSSWGLPVHRFFVALGDASFSYYLIHYFVISVAERFLHIDSFSVRNIILMLFSVVVSWVISYVSYCIIEKWFGGLLVGKLNNYIKKRRSTVGVQ